MGAEEYCVIYLYKKFLDNNIEYENLVIKEELVNEYNNFIKQENNIEMFVEFISQYKDRLKNFIDVFQKKPWKYVKPVIWDDGGKEDYFIKSLEMSHKFEIFIECEFALQGVDIQLYHGKNEQYEEGECAAGIEIKNDALIKKTGNVYIEFNERRKNDGQWVNSGILKNDNSRYFLIGDYDAYYILKRETLMDCYIDLNIKDKADRKYPTIEKKCAKRGTSKGFIIPINLVNKLTISMEEIIKELLEDGFRI